MARTRAKEKRVGWRGVVETKHDRGEQEARRHVQGVAAGGGGGGGRRSRAPGMRERRRESVKTVKKMRGRRGCDEVAQKDVSPRI